MISIKIEGRKATVVSNEIITTGSAGLKVTFAFSEEWINLTKIAVFAGKRVKFINLGNEQEIECAIPWETLECITHDYRIGVYGTDGNDTVIPTIYANLGSVFKGAENPNYKNLVPTPMLIDQLATLVANAKTLAERATETIERAIPEIKEFVGTYFTEHIKTYADSIESNKTNITKLTTSKADKTDLDTTNDEVTALSSRISKAENNITSLGTSKADKNYVDTELAKKADKTTVSSDLAKKADKIYTDTELANKADGKGIKFTVINGILTVEYEG